MILSDAIRTATNNLAAHKLRSSLTMLGMIFGVGAVVAMLSIGAGAERQALDLIERMGIRNIMLRSKEMKPDELQAIRKKSPGICGRDVQAIKESIPGVMHVTARLEIKAYKIIAAGSKADGRVFGVSCRDYNWPAPVAEGRLLDELDEKEHAQTCVIGPAIRRSLFGYGPAVGQDLKVNDVWLEVVGVLEGAGRVPTDKKVASTTREIYLPVTTAARKFDRDPLESPFDELVVELDEHTPPMATAAVMQNLIDRIHGGAEDYEIVVPEQLLEQSRQTQRLFSIVMGSIAGISLLVGGIGIMNIMMANVFERTREIGIRMAIGARRREIRDQFLIEAFAISMIGGLAGVVTGIGIARVVAAYAGWPTIVTVGSIVLSTGVSVAVGLISGAYPAYRAAGLDPIRALGYE